MSKRKRQFIEELIDQVPREKRARFKELAAIERYQHSGHFRFIFFSCIYFLCLGISLLIFAAFSPFEEWMNQFTRGGALYFLSFLLMVFIGWPLKDLRFKLNQRGIHLFHLFFISFILLFTFFQALFHFFLNPVV